MDVLTTFQRQARALGDPTRHEIFRYVASATRPVRVAELTEHIGLHHNAVRQHLAKLVEAGLVDESRAAASGRGRPPLKYRVDPSAESRWGVTGPYERLSHLLAEIIRTGDDPVEVGRRVAREETPPSAPGSDVVDDLVAAMARQGFDPEVHRRGACIEVVLHHCPFESTAIVDPETVCALHRGIAEGVASRGEGVVVDELVAKDPRRAGCRLRLRLEP